MLGAMIGDIVGSKYEFNNTFDYDFELFGGGCDFTDDTISHGGDSDTIGAIVGSIAEARFGIPQEMKEKALNYLPDDMKDIWKQFAEKSQIKQE